MMPFYLYEYAGEVPHDYAFDTPDMKILIAADATLFAAPAR